MARPRQPIELLLYKGKKHLTKKEIESRKSQEIRAPSDKVKPPSYVPKELRKEFNKFAKHLVDMGVMTNLDVNPMARYVLLNQHWVALIAELGEADNRSELFMDLLLKQEKLSKQLDRLESKLGLSPADRCKLSPTKKEVVKEPTEEEQLFGDTI